MFRKFKLRSPEEGGAGQPEGEPQSGDAGGAPTKPTLPPDDHEITLANGEVITYGELKQGYSRTADYHVKTQEAAETKRQADEILAEAQAVKAEGEGNLAEATKIRTAVATDVEWYSTHPQTEWAAYQTEEGKLAGTQTPAAPAPPSPPAGDGASNKATEDRLMRLEEANATTAKNIAADAAVTSINEVAGSAGHELVTPKLLATAVNAFRLENGKMPTHAEIQTLAKDTHEELANAGIPIPKGTIPASSSTKPVLSTDNAPSIDPAWKDLNIRKDRVKTEDALAGFMGDLQARKG